MTTMTAARREVSPTTNYSWTRRLSRTAHAPQKPLYQAVSAPPPHSGRARSAMCICIKDGVFIDPCMGSGHILVYAFDVLMQMYTSEGYSERDAAALILEKNIYGLEIDRRAYQLAYFALMMKARQYSRRILMLDVKPQVYYPGEYPDGQEYGSLVRVDELEPMLEESKESQITLFDGSYAIKLNTWNFRRLLSQKYDAVVTNPPYMESKGMSAKLSEYVQKNFPDSKSDLFAVFIERCGQLLKPSGYQAMITQHAWMFLSSYEKLRDKLLFHDIVNMAHLGARAFEEIGGEVVQTTAFVMNVRKTPGFLGTYARLVDYGSQDEKETAFLSATNRHTAASDNFAKIPGSPVAYWVGDKMLQAFEIGELLEKVGTPSQGMSTCDVNRFIKFWYEVSVRNTNIYEHENHHKWVRYNKGGEYRKWYGNRDTLVYWGESGDTLFANNAVIRNKHQYFKEFIAWSKISSSGTGFRDFESDFLFDGAGGSFFPFESTLKKYLLGFLNTRIAAKILNIISPTLNYNESHIGSMPIIVSESKEEKIDVIVGDNIALSRSDWDAFETSWDFKRHPLV
jgi:hypothetical protein